MTTNQKMEAMLFDYGTMNLTDYRITPLKAPTITKYHEKGTCLRVRPPPLKDIHTLYGQKSNGIPFSLFHKPRGTDPTKVQQPYFKPPDEGKQQAIKTRPRLVMTPAVSVDDIENPEARTLLLDDMYTSDMTRAMREGLRPYFKVVAPVPDHPANSNPIKLPKLVPPYVSPEWRVETFAWEQKQLRGLCDATKNFWLSSKLPPCRACESSNAAKAHDIQKCQLKQERRLQTN